MITPTMDEDHIVESTGTGFNRKTLHREVFFMYFVLCINLYLWRGILGPFTKPYRFFQETGKQIGCLNHFVL
jgi:hypothetical protein